MPLRVNFNYESLTAQRNLSTTQGSFFRSVERISSGLRINRAADDAAGLAVSEKLKNQVRGMNQAQRNAQDAISLMQVAEGTLNQTHAILARMRELAIQGANDTLTTGDRNQINAELGQLSDEIDRIARSTQFNTVNLLDGTYTSKFFQVGANNGQVLTLSIDPALGACVLAAAVSVSSAATACSAIVTIDSGVVLINSIRGLLGAMQNRMEYTILNLGVGSENTAAANSRIRDADVAKESAELVRTQILQQAASAVLAQANQAPQFALSLLR